ncbi:hypothetical protein BJV78DRAFT_1281836 [Lactifluus subvellereus]|nr:hypothetical protein BJV78DRAFT_1281836 [Lactifluus subvellereus]
MSNHTAVNKAPIVEHNSGRYQTQTTPSASTMMGNDSTLRFPDWQDDVQVSFYSDEFACPEPELDKFRSESSIRISTAQSAAISLIDKEIEAARLHILTLLTRRNALAPISLLPSELLARIFHLHMLGEPSWSNRGIFACIDVTHVCRHWRQVALGDSSLWARFSGLPPSTTRLAEILARAKDAPLIIDFDAPQGSKMVSMFSPHLSHIRELRLRNLCDSLVDGNSIRELCSLEAPMLEHFELRVVSFSSVTVQTSVGQRFFKGQAPKLRTFSLCQIQIPWSLVPRTQLSQLRIVLSKEISTTDDIPSFDDLNQLIDLLTNSPTLEVLVLEFCLPSILSHLRCPSENNNGLILPIISAHFNHPKFITFKSIVLTLNYTRESIELTGSSSLPTWTNYSSHIFDCNLGSDAELCLWIGTRLHFDHLPNTLERVCTMLPIAEVEFLSISVSDIVHSINWGRLFRHSEEITTIKACGRGTITLLQTLTLPRPSCTTSSSKRRKRGGDEDAGAQGTDSTATDVTPVFPKLTTLLLRGLDFSEKVPGCGDLHDILINALRWRTLHNVPLKKLSIDGSVISADHASALEKLVQEFHWGKVRRLQFSDFYWDESDYEGENDSDYSNRWY